MRASENLHLAQQMAEVLGVPSRASAALHVWRFGNRQARACEDVAHGLVPRALQRRGVDADAGRRGRAIDVVGEKELPRVSPEIVHGALGSASTLGRPAAKLEHPIRTVADVIAELLH